MIFLLDTSHDHAIAAKELGAPVGQLLTPLTRRSRKSDTFAIDNGCFKRFDQVGFESLLNRERDRAAQCKFVCVPDVVFNARRTMEVFDQWAFRACLIGYRKALVIQDGQDELPIPWQHIDAIFIGGSDNFKSSIACAQIIKAAQLLNKWTHVGRVNGRFRFNRFITLGVNSADGTGISRYSQSRLDVNVFMRHPTLFEDTGK